MSKNTKEKERVVSFPRMGNAHIPVVAMFQTMGAKIQLSDPNNRETLSIGTRHSVETVCLPYKLNLGNYIQAIESGANTLIMFEAPGSCRLGNYAALADAKLKELGYDCEMVVFNLYKGKISEIIKKFSYATGCKSFIKAIKGFRLGHSKFDAMDTVERALFHYRPREIKQGDSEKVYKRALKEIENANRVRTVKQATEKALKAFQQIPIDKDREIIKVYLTGEFFVLLDPFTNMEIEKELGYLGVEVERQVMLSDWTNNILLPKWLHKKESHRQKAMRYSGTYMTRAIGGDCVESIGDTVHASRIGIDGVVHIGPFNCNPEVVSQNILPHVSKNESIPVISLSMDEQTGRAGLVTRLEAFVDLIRRRKRSAVAI
ncbi:MAG: CoA protein activase [bacterium]